MWLFAGLGNVGTEYAGTRHNIGFEVVDAFERGMNKSSGWRAARGEFYAAKGQYKTEDVLLIKPTTFMNLSGRAVRDAMQFYKIDLSQVVIICDDIAIPLGVLRLRLKGSDGGHNGLGSIIYELGTDEYARLRCGVGSDFRKGEQVRYVLSRFKTDERDSVITMIDESVIALRTIAEKGLEKAMNAINVARTSAEPSNPNADKSELR